ncbi:hypothetical protein [Streptosporangium sp. NPDC051022]|uniref:hypothetical protein n=1 Tax=Streptosporangium sp. NPDC051022 TaxID=3155752 RepID=UPI00341885AB
MTFSIETIARLRDQVKICQDQAAADEARLSASRAVLDEWSALLAHAEAHAVPQGPTPTLAFPAGYPYSEAGRAPFEPMRPAASEPDGGPA